MFTSFFGITIGAILMVGLFSRLMRSGALVHSSWPTWLLIPIAIFLALPMGVQVQDPLRPFAFMVFAIVLSRWLIALGRREQNLGWGFYMIVLIAAEGFIHPAALWFAKNQ